MTGGRWPNHPAFGIETGASGWLKDRKSHSGGGSGGNVGCQKGAI